MEILFASGFRVKVTTDGLVQVFRHRWTMLYYFSIVAIFCIAGPFSDLRSVEPWCAYLVWTLNVFIAFLLISGSILALHLSHKLKAIWSTFITAMIIFPYFFISSCVVLMVSGVIHSHIGHLELLTFDFIVFELGFQFFGSYIIPRVLIDIDLGHLAIKTSAASRRKAEVPHNIEHDLENRLIEVTELESVSNDTIEIDRRKLPVSSIRYMKAQENYVLISRAENNELLRGRITDISEAMPIGSGCQVHRSYWVSKTAIEGIRRTSGNLEIELKNDGQLIPISRSRRADVVSWLRMHRSDIL